MPAKSKAQWRYLFANFRSDKAKRLAQGEGSSKRRYKSLPAKKSK